MKKLLLIFTLLFSTLMFSTPSYAEWTKVGTTNNGENTTYVDFERIRKHGGYVYWWDLLDRLKPTKLGFLSSKGYHQGDCKLFRVRYLSWIFYIEPMGGGAGNSGGPKDPQWDYPDPDSVMGNILKIVCSG